MNIAVTGGASFIGSHLVEKLLKEEHQITIIDDLSSGSRDNLKEVQQEVEFVVASVEDTEILQQVFKKQDALFHLAAKHGGRGYIESHPVECLGNLGLDHGVFINAARAGIEKIIYASSACVYPVDLQEKVCFLRESDASWLTRGGSFADGAYGWAKLVGEMQLETIKHEYGISGSSARIFTAYGERENLTHALPALLSRAIKKEDPFPVWGDGLQTRNFTYVSDTVQGLCLALTNHDEPAINIGLEKHISINDLLEEIFTLINWRPQSIEYQKEAPVGVLHRASDNSLSRKIFNWEPRITIQEGLERTLAYLEKV